MSNWIILPGRYNVENRKSKHSDGYSYSADPLPHLRSKLTLIIIVLFSISLSIQVKFSFTCRLKCAFQQRPWQEGSINQAALNYLLIQYESCLIQMTNINGAARWRSG